MKKIFYVLLLTAITLQGQTTGVNKLKIASNPEKTTATRVVVQDATTGEVGYVDKSTLQTDISGKENTITAGTTSQYWRGDKTWQTLNKAAVGLGNVDNTSDADKPVSTAAQTALNAKENTITSGTTSQYWRGDKTWQTLNKAAVGLGNLDNTSDADKPVSTAAQTALNAKQATLVSGTSIKTINGNSLLGSGDLSISSGGGTVSSVSGTGSVSGLTLSGTVTSTGSLTLGGALSLTSANVTGALGFTPYNATNPNGYITTAGRAFPKKADGSNLNFYLSGTISTSATGATTILGTENGTDVNNYSPSSLSVGYASNAGSLSNMNISQFTNNSGYITGISSGNVTSALGFTPYNSSNPSGFISTSGARSALSFTPGSGAYNSSTGVITIPTNTNQLTNGAGFITGSYLPLSGGTVSGSITATAFYASSDKRLKNIIARDGDMIQYTWKDKRDTKVHYGYVAQEVKKEMPSQVSKDDKGYLAVNYIEVLVAKVNDLEKEVKRLKAKRK